MGFPYPVIDKDSCIDCGKCDAACSFHDSQFQQKPRAEAIRFPSLLKNSQSGGLGFAIMKKAVRADYIIYGAALDPDFQVRHRRVVEETGLEALRLSKYAQSDMAGIPAKVLEDLSSGHKVLFTGTPCQCAGIAEYCRQYSDSLLLADIICHGVLSPSVWQAYLHDAQISRGESLNSAVFRDPAKGWHDYFTKLTFESGTQHEGSMGYLYSQGFIYRPACTNCPFASGWHVSDITMGDCWGVKKMLPGFADDELGCSLLLTRTEKGLAFTSTFEDDCVRAEIPYETAMALNHHSPAKSHVLRYFFEKDYICKGFAFVQKKYGGSSALAAVTRFLPRLNPTNTKLYKKLFVKK